jgi:hypothetical protein
MKKIVSILFLVLAFNAQSEEIYTLSVDSLAHGGSAKTQVVLDGNKVYIEHENSTGFSCYFDGMYTGGPKATYEAMDSKSSCKVTVEDNRDGSKNITSKGNCVGDICSAGAELEVEGLTQQQ